MALTTGEVRRLKAELGYNVLSSGAEPYVGVDQLFEQVISPYMTAGAVTTSSTSVEAATTPTPVTLTLASASGFSQFDRVVVDCDALQEIATVRSVSGSTISVVLSLAHDGTYPVTVEGGESLVRQILNKLDRLGNSLGFDAADSAGIKKVDEIEFFGGGGGDAASELRSLREYWRRELASILGVPYLRDYRAGGGSAISLC